MAFLEIMPAHRLTQLTGTEGRRGRAFKAAARPRRGTHPSGQRYVQSKGTGTDADHGIRSHHFLAKKWGNNGNRDRLYFLGLQNQCRW